MSAIPPFHSVNEVKKPVGDRVHHNNSACASGRDIPYHERVQGDAGYRVCIHCKRLN